MKKAFIVDDNALSAQGIAKSIPWDKLGIEMAGVFYDSQSVLKHIVHIHPDIVISDIKMPGISGLELTKKLLDSHMGIKIILVSAYSDFQYAQEALRLGAFDYIEKPIDYGYLEEIIGNAADQIDRDHYYLESIRRSQPAMVENFFHNLIHSFPEDARYYLNDYIPYLGIGIDSRFYVSLIIDIENSEDIRTRFGFEKYYVSQMELKDELLKTFSACDLKHILIKHNRLIVIMGMNLANPAEVIHFINDRLAELMDKKKYVLLDYNIGIGNIVRDIWHIRQSYENAKLALEYRFFFTQKNIFDIRDCVNRSPLLNTWSEAQEEKLIQLLCRKDLDGLSSYTASLAETFLRIQDKRQILVILYSLSNRILKFFYDINLDDQKLFARVTSIYQNIDSYQSCDAICKDFYDICRESCKCLTQSVNSYHSQLCRAVTEYIQSNYSNPDLGLNDLAMHVNISNAHLSSIFKNTTGISVSDAINNARIDAARLLLTNTSCSIKEISMRVGYANQYYFSACFKKKTDMTPSGYRTKFSSDS